jgi:hypothetical protein
VADSSSSAQTITNDVTEFSMATPRAIQDTTGVDKSAHERLQLLADCTFSLKGVFNNAANMSHQVLSTMSSTSVVRAAKVTPTVGTTPYLAANCYIASYDVTRSATGELTWASELQLADGATPTWTNS